MQQRIRRAVVTGASAGIGECLAHRLAARGIDLVLVARREDRLRRLAAALPVDVEVVGADLSDPLSLGRVEARVAATTDPVDLLVNNAGAGAYGDLAAMDPATGDALIGVHVLATTRLTRAVLPQLLARNQGGVINVGSTAGYQPGPHAAVYGASKAYIRSFTEAVHEEVRGSGVHVLLLAPGVTATEFSTVAGVRDGAVPAALVMDPDDVALAALRAFAGRRPVCVPGAINRIMAVGAQLVPSRLSRRLSAPLLRCLVPR